MKNSQIIQLGREIIYLAGYYKHYTETDKPRIKKKLELYKQELGTSSNKYTKKLLNFIDDLLGDIENKRELQIDSLFEDDFVGNYYLTKKQAQYYNNLFPASIYQEILATPEKADSIIEKQYSIFKENFKKLNPELISDTLLIFTLFELESPKPQLKRLYIFSSKLGLSSHSKRLVRNMLQEYTILLKHIKKYGIKNIHTKNIHSKYIQVEKGELETFSFNLQDASKENSRSGNILFEYKELLKNL